MKWIPDNSKQGTFTIVVFLLLLVCVKVGFSFNNPKEYFLGNLLPELTGMFIELVIIFVILERWQAQNKKEKLIIKEKRLREYLIFFLKHGFKSLPIKSRIGRFYGVDHTKNIEDLDNILRYIADNGLSEKEMESIKLQCKIDLNTFGNLLPVAADITDDHFKAWGRIVFFMVQIDKDIGDNQESVRDIIANIKRYEIASFENDIYVGANNV
ncbi:hypothetical protein C5F61_13615 [Photobacterium damselae subsp. damselae]|uniref:hypothetical protein n=1 Tax=Photobacterium damselae TaxID=38293 RepID=UPI000D04F857|nr:hypothetical protein [Photobacterium damselae]PSB76937.1 hypothetical protein C5F61_13615 [Photobacterium damselae subsp. damselae]